MKPTHINTFQKTLTFSLFLLILSFNTFAQSLTSSPYSRYGFGELNTQSFAAQSAMGNCFIAYQQDSIAPFFINTANPAGLSGIKLTILELGGQAQFSNISSSSTKIYKTNTNFSYGSVAFPIKKIGGAAFGIMPYSTSGYKITSLQEEAAGTMTYIYKGDGGLSKAFIGTGIKPFMSKEYRFYSSNLADTLTKYQRVNRYKFYKFGNQIISNISIGASANYIFGTINQTTDVIYPSQVLYFNAKRQRSTQVSDFTINGGIQTHFTIDSVKNRSRESSDRQNKKVALKERILIGTGFYINSPMNLNAVQNNIIYNYAIDGGGNEKPKDTLLNLQNVSGSIKLPLEMGIGLSIKKGDKLTVLLDGSITNWSGYKNFEALNSELKNSYKISTGLNYVPNKLAFGSANYIKRIQYRIGGSFSNGYLDLKNTRVNHYFVSLGLGLPVGAAKYDARGRCDEIGVVNLSVQVGRNGTTTNQLLKEEFIKFNLGFTFNKRWFIKYKYD